MWKRLYYPAASYSAFAARSFDGARAEHEVAGRGAPPQLHRGLTFLLSAGSLSLKTRRVSKRRSARSASLWATFDLRTMVGLGGGG